MFGGRNIKNFVITNMSYKCTFKIYMLTFLIIAMLFSTGCSSKQEKEEPQGKQQSASEEEDKVPELLEELENSIEKIIKNLDGPSVEVKEDEEGQAKGQGSQQGLQENKQQGTEQKQGDKQQGDSQQGNQESGQSSNGQQEVGQQSQEQQAQGQQGQNQQSQGQQTQGQQQTGAGQAAPGDPWKQITPVINDLHYKWNSFLPMAVKKGAGMPLIDGFSNALNSLTDTIIGKNKTNTLMAASYLYAYIPQLYSLYKTEVSPEIKRIRYCTRNSMLNAMTGNWEQAGYDLNSLKSSWTLFKNTLPAEMQENSSMLELSIYEFEKVVQKKNQSLTDIKGRVAMSNIETLEKALEDKRPPE
jgi:hypothetical protein